MAHQQQQGGNGGTNGLNLPAGFRFHPTDEEIITHYLRPKVLNPNFTAIAIGEADLNKSEPWELPLMANMGENEWYFFCQKDRKYPTGTRANRATETGYWKATGKDREIYRSTVAMSVLVGLKKTLVFYKGRAPRGEKTNWVMHEYKLPNHDIWVVCRVFHKSSGNENAPDLTSPAEQQTTMERDDNNMGLRSTSVPTPTKSPVEPDHFTIGTSASTYSTADGTGSVLPPLPPTVGMGSMGHQLNNAKHFGDMVGTTEPTFSFYQQVGTGTSSNNSFMVEPHSWPASVPPRESMSEPRLDFRDLFSGDYNNPNGYGDHRNGQHF